MAGISIREFIRWLPAEASEPTSTMVLTSPGRRFVDIRIQLPVELGRTESTNIGGIPLERVDWALAGTSSSSVVEDGPNGPITRGQWRRWIDSRATDTANVIDEGVNYPQSDGTILEKGRMVNPATGTDQEYEELWRDQDILPAGFPRARAVVLQFDEGLEYRGSIVRVGQYCQGILRKGDHMTTERWEWTAANNWTKTVSFGGDTMPTHLALDEHVTVPLQEGQAHEFGGVSWKVIEVAEL